MFSFRRLPPLLQETAADQVRAASAMQSGSRLLGTAPSAAAGAAAQGGSRRDAALGQLHTGLVDVAKQLNLLLQQGQHAAQQQPTAPSDSAQLADARR